jgi:hypothetical protein
MFEQIFPMKPYIKTTIVLITSSICLILLTCKSKEPSKKPKASLNNKTTNYYLLNKDIDSEYGYPNEKTKTHNNKDTISKKNSILNKTTLDKE